MSDPSRSEPHRDGRDRPSAGPSLGVKLTLAAVLLLLAAVNALAVWGIFARRDTARSEARRELERSAAADARALEAALASLRADLVFLARSPPLAQLPAASASDDPMVRRWGRLDAEAILLLFLEANPPIERLELLDAAGAAVLAVGRSAGAPIPVPPHPRPVDAQAAVGPYRLTAEATAAITDPESDRPAASAVAVWIHPGRLLAGAAPGRGDGLALLAAPTAGVAADVPSADLPSTDEAADRAPTPDGADLVVTVPLVADAWTPPIRWRLVGRRQADGLIRSVEQLAREYRLTVALNLLIVSASLLLGWLALRQLRRTARLEAAAEQQARVRELERQLFHGERLATVGRLAAGIAHEINNPLEGMANYLRLLDEEIAAGRQEEARRWLGRVEEGADRMASVIRQLLTFSSPDRAPATPVELAPVIRQAAEFVASNPTYRAVNVTIELPERPLVVLGNQITLGQLFFNLILNACQVQPDGGEVEIGAAVEPAEGGGWPDRGEGDEVAAAREMVLVTVRDRGPGLAEEALAHLFEPFFSTRGSSGLGLAVCRGIAEQHRGTIRAHNWRRAAGDRAGDGGIGGAELIVELPLAAVEGPPDESAGDAHEDDAHEDDAREDDAHEDVNAPGAARYGAGGRATGGEEP